MVLELKHPRQDLFLSQAIGKRNGFNEFNFNVTSKIRGSEKAEKLAIKPYRFQAGNMVLLQNGLILKHPLRNMRVTRGLKTSLLFKGQKVDIFLAFAFKLSKKSLC